MVTDSVPVQCSTVSVLLELENFVTESLQRKDVQSCHILAVDLEKGFDKMSHRLLLDKMRSYNFDNYIVSFLENYLSNRQQRVKWTDRLVLIEK